MPLGWLRNSSIVQTCQLFTRAKKLLKQEAADNCVMSWFHTLSTLGNKNLFYRTPRTKIHSAHNSSVTNSPSEGQCFFDCSILKQHPPWRALKFWEQFPGNYIYFVENHDPRGCGTAYTSSSMALWGARHVLALASFSALRPVSVLCLCASITADTANANSVT